MEHITTERRRIDLELHQAETAIGLGRRMVRELVRCEPVDHEAIEAQRVEIEHARLTRNSLRRELEAAKLAQDSGMPRYRWAIGG